MTLNIKRCERCGDNPKLIKGKYPYEEYFRLKCLECGYGTDSLKDLHLVVEKWNAIETGEDDEREHKLG